MIDAVQVVARLIVGLVLVIAGVAKVRSRGWGILAAEMGTPRPVIVVLPAVETVLGVAVVFGVGFPVVGLLAAVLFGVFTAVVIRIYRSGSEAPCNCFGADGSQDPVSKKTIARNVLLTVLAVVACI